MLKARFRAVAGSQARCHGIKFDARRGQTSASGRAVQADGEARQWFAHLFGVSRRNAVHLVSPIRDLRRVGKALGKISRVDQRPIVLEPARDDITGEWLVCPGPEARQRYIDVAGIDELLASGGKGRPKSETEDRRDVPVPLEASRVWKSGGQHHWANTGEYSHIYRHSQTARGASSEIRMTQARVVSYGSGRPVSVRQAIAATGLVMRDGQSTVVLGEPTRDRCRPGFQGRRRSVVGASTSPGSNSQRA